MSFVSSLSIFFFNREDGVSKTLIFFLQGKCCWFYCMIMCVCKTNSFCENGFLKMNGYYIFLLLFPVSMADSRDGREQQPDDELSIPRAALNKMIKELLPNIRVANDARELILNCCTEFIHLVSSEANEICVKLNKKTISPDHIVSGISL